MCSNSVIRPGIKLSSAELWKKLDLYLKTNRVRFGDLFAQHDVDNSGALDAAELARLVEEVLGTRTPLAPSDIAYLMAMLDLDASRSISAEEFLTAAKQFMELSARPSAVQEKEVKDTLAAACAAMRGPGKVSN